MPLSPRRVLRTFKYAMYFDGVNNYVLVPHSPSLMPTAVTAIVWFAPLGLTSAYIRLLEKGGWSVGGGYGLEINPAFKPVIRFNIWNGGTVNTIDSTTTLKIGIMFYVAGVFDGSTMRLYVNLNLEGSKSASMTSNTWELYIGRRAYNPGNYFSGYMVQVLLYSRALSDSEVQWNYQNFDNPVRNGLVLWLKADPQYVKDIDGDGILEWIDLSGYNNHGKIYGAQLVQLIKTLVPVRALKPVRVLKPIR